MDNRTKIVIGFLTLLFISSGIAITLNDDVRIEVEKDFTQFKVPRSDMPWFWTISGVEENRLFDGTSIMNRDRSEIEIDTRIDESTNEVWITRTTPYIRGPVVKDTYYFRGDVEDLELFPISHTVNILNASGKFYRYTVDDLSKTGERRKIEDRTFLYFGKNMKVEFQKKNKRWSWVGWPYGSDSFSAQYDIPSDNETYKVRLLDPKTSLDIRNYSKNDLKVIFSDTLNGDNFLNLTLKSHSSVNEVKNICLNEIDNDSVNSCAVSIYYDSLSKYYLENVLGEPTFKDMRTGEKVEREWRYVIRKEVEEKKPIVECGYFYVEENQTEEYQCMENGFTTEKRMKWVPYNSKNIPEGKSEIGIEVENQIGDHMDIVIEVASQKLERHAQYQNLDIPFDNYEIFNNTALNETFTVPVGVDKLGVLLVAGGGGGNNDGSSGGAGGGGAGGLYHNESYTSGVTAGADFTISIGAGGTEGGGNEFGGDGGDSWFGTVKAIGGGGGAPRSGDGNDGGSGGGGGGESGTCLGGTGQQPGSASGGFGNDGGDGECAGNRMGGGGGGADGVGATADGTATGSTGGPGRVVWNLTWAHGGDGKGNSNTTGPGGFPENHTGFGGNSGSGGNAQPGAAGIAIVAYNISTFPPSVVINTPLNQSYTVTEITFNITASDVDDDDATLDSCWFNLNGGGNTTLTQEGSTDYFSFTNSSMTQKVSHTARFFCNDTDGSLNNTESVTFSIDSINPMIFYNPSTEGDGEYLPRNWALVNVTATDTNLDTVVFNWNGTNETFDVNSGDRYWENQSALTDGEYSFYAYVNDTFGNSNSTSQRNITIDTISPKVSYNPSTDADLDIVNRNWILVNISATDTNLDAVQMEFNGVNETFANNVGNNYWENKTGLSDGPYDFFGWANDSAGNINSTATRTVTVDTTNPLIDYVAPTEANNTNRSRNWIFVNVSVTEPNEDTITFDLYNDSGLVNSTSSTASQRTINWTGLANTLYYYNVTVNDSTGRTNNTATRWLRLDTVIPFVNVTFPTNTSYGLTNAPSTLNYTANDDASGLHTCWYSLDGGATNTTISCGTNVTGLTPEDDLNNWTVYVNDTAGNENSSRVFFTFSSVDFNATITGGVNFTFTPDNSTHQGVQPPGQNSTLGVITIHNNLSNDIDVFVRLNETFSNITFKMAGNSTYADALTIGTTYIKIYNNLSQGSTDYLWAWADYDNALRPWFPQLTVKGSVLNWLYLLMRI